MMRFKLGPIEFTLGSVGSAAGTRPKFAGMTRNRAIMRKPGKVSVRGYAGNARMMVDKSDRPQETNKWTPNL
jgi:hypothetical protein